jgi:parvulin-like peptidyl-prolyl isomerase
MILRRTVLSAIVLTGAAVLCLGAGACGRKPVSPPLAEGFRLDDPEKAALPALEIEGTEFTNAEFARFVRVTLGENDNSLTAEAASRLFDDFVERKLISRQAADQNIGLTDEEKSASMEMFRAGSGGNESSGAQKDPDPEDLYEGWLVEKFLALQVRDLFVADAEVEPYYEAHKSDYLQPERLQVSQILLAGEGRASEILDKLKNTGEKEFRDVARAESAGSEAGKGGLMGVFSLGQLPLELEKVIFALQEGRISRVVQSAYGYHIFRLDKKFESRLMPAAEAAPLVRAKLLEEKSQAAIETHLSFLKKSMKWTMIPENLPFIYQKSE